MIMRKLSQCILSIHHASILNHHKQMGRKSVGNPKYAKMPSLTSIATKLVKANLFLLTISTYFYFHATFRRLQQVDEFMCYYCFSVGRASIHLSEKQIVGT